MQDHTPNLGSLPGPDAKRDAVHVAVVPATAAYLLLPGQRVCRLPDGQFGTAGEPVGIVDPFRDDVVRAGEQFWLCLFPGTVTSLRHVWTHPAFQAAPPGGER